MIPHKAYPRPPVAGEPDDPAALVARLPPRCLDVLQGILAGQANKAIAHHLGISPRTVEIHRARMMKLLGASHVAEAIRLGLEAGRGSTQSRQGVASVEATALRVEIRSCKRTGAAQGRWSGVRRAR